MVEDKTAFPSTMKGLGAHIHGLTVSSARPPAEREVPPPARPPSR